MRLSAMLTVLALVLVLMSGCQMQPVRSMDNGAAGGEEWKLPVPVWPFGPCALQPPKEAEKEAP